MSPDEIETIAEAAAEKAVAKLMFSLGLDISDNDDILKARADMTHLRNQREACETVKKHALTTAVTVLGTFFTGIVGYLVMTFRGGGH